MTGARKVQAKTIPRCWLDSREQSEELGNGILPCDHEDKLHRRHDCTWGIWQGRKIIRVNDQLIARGSLLSLTLWILDVSYTSAFWQCYWWQDLLCFTL
ncbi:unnamed protein product [Musa acuminata subsp. malaccensis]|uniref:(wild Malaysian banana) hypothetical protein n=1 Tax=Musa acuminata subsp. malaccensis TaxID=214687 RepID=A0A804K4L5_MUSAM|nr:unnamed protein product [Musa acuminata subsp. malaccensis]